MKSVTEWITNVLGNFYAHTIYFRGDEFKIKAYKLTLKKII